MRFLLFLYALLAPLLGILITSLLSSLLLRVAIHLYPYHRYQSLPQQQTWQRISLVAPVYVIMAMLGFTLYCISHIFYTFFDAGIWFAILHYLLSIPVLLLLYYQEKNMLYRITKLVMDILFGFLFAQAAVLTYEQWL